MVNGIVSCKNEKICFLKGNSERLRTDVFLLALGVCKINVMVYESK